MAMSDVAARQDSAEALACRHRQRPWVSHNSVRSVAGVVIVLTIALLAAAPLRTRVFGHDEIFLLDNGWRALHGQRVHVDYTSGWGPLTFLLIAAGLVLSGGGVVAASYASALAVCVVGLWAVWLSAPRASGLFSVAYPSFVAAMAAGPFVLGVPPALLCHAMIYNRWGYALLALIMLECLVPNAWPPDSKRPRFESALTGVAIGLLLFLKVTYFLVGLMFVGMSLVVQVRRKERAWACMAGFGATTFAFLWYLRFDAVAMVRDLAMAAAARTGALGIGNRFAALAVGAPVHFAILAAVVLGSLKVTAGGRPGRLQWLQAILLAAAVVLGDAALILTNAQEPRIFVLTAACAVTLLFSWEPVLRSAERTTPRLAVLIVGTLILAAPVTLTDALGFLWAAIDRCRPIPAGVVPFEPPRLRDLVLVDAQALEPRANGREYVHAVNDGARLLLAHTTAADKVATLDMFNPFAYALGRPPIRGGIAAAAYRYTLDERHHPSPERFFGDAAVLMVPKSPASPPRFYDGYKRIYEPAIARDFRLVAESERWWLYRRVTPVRLTGSN